MIRNPGGAAWWANMALPPGWEAKYDQNTKKYFFVHHSTRSTQWIDPRKAYYEQQRGGGIAPGPSPGMPHSSPRMPHSSPRMPVHAGPMIHMQPIAKPKCKTCRSNEVTTANQDCQGCQLKASQREAELVRAREAEEAERKKQENQQRIQKEQERRRVESAERSRTQIQRDTDETSFSTETIEREELTEGQKRTLINNLDEAFPDVQRNIVEMVLEASTWDAEKASSVLCSMSPQKPKAKPKASPAAVTAVPAPPAAAAKPKPSEQPSKMVKKKMIEQLQKTFGTASDTLIELALETTHYNVSRATQVLRMTISPESSRMATKDYSKAKTTTTTSTTAASSASSSVTAGTSPTIIPVSSPSQPITSAPTVSVVITSISKPSIPPSSPSRAAGTSSGSEAPERKKTTTAVGAKGATRRTRSVERAAPRMEFHSPFTGMTRGPDPSLVSGPNKDNLLDGYISYGGSDKTIVRGPEKSNITGPSSSTGHNISLAIGPQGCHNNGPQANSAKGSMYQANRQM